MVMEKSIIDKFKKYYLLCLSLDGIPLFTRSHGDIPSLPFSFTGSLNAVHMFTKSNKVLLNFTQTENAQIFWKEFHQIKLILVLFDNNEENIYMKKYLENTVDNIYSGMVMICGENEFKIISNIEKLKRKLKLVFPLITSFLNNEFLLGSVTQLTDVILTSYNNLLSQYLNAFAEECDSEFACILLHSKVVVATEQFWQLQSIEMILILFLNQTQQSTCDIPIYLPNGSPTVPHRLVIIKLLNNLNVALVCGPEPSLQTIITKYVNKYFCNIITSLQTCLQSYPREVPTDVRLDENVLSYLLLNNSEGKCLSSFYPHGHMTGSDQDFMSDVAKRRVALIGFYRTMLEQFVDNDLPHRVIERYCCTNKYKCFFLEVSSRQIFVLFKFDVSTYTMKSIAKKLIKQLLHDKIL